MPEKRIRITADKRAAPKTGVVIPGHSRALPGLEKTGEEAWTAVLEEQSRFIRLIIDSSPVAIMIYDAIKERNVFASRQVEKLMGYSPYEIKALGSNMLRTLAHPDDFEEQQRLLRELAESGAQQVQDVTYRIVHKDGKVIHANARRSVFKRSASGKPTEFIVILNDVTARVNAEREMVSKNERERELDLKRQKENLNAIVAAQEKERVRLGEALHDGVAQLLYGIQTRVQVLDKNPSAQNVQEILSIVNEAIRDTRNITFELVPAVLKDYGVEVALRELFRRIVKNPLQVQLTFIDGRRLPEEIEFTLYRIVQELVSNIVRHADAGKAWVRIKCRMYEISMLVIDNGKGFDESKISAQHKGIGLQNIKNRLSLLEGNYCMKSGPEGTIVAASFPLPKQTCGKPQKRVFTTAIAQKK